MNMSEPVPELALVTALLCLFSTCKGNNINNALPFYYQKDKKQQVLVSMWGKGNPVHCWWQCRLLQPLWKQRWNFLKKLKIELPCDPTNPLLNIYPKEWNHLVKTSAPPCSLQHYSQQPRYGNNPGDNRWTNAQMQYYSALKTNEILPCTTTWMSLVEVIVLSETNKDTEKNGITSFIYGILIIKSNIQR